ncbi:MAG: RsmE family RNA methyltransferase [Planctomycetota bacterium]
MTRRYYVSRPQRDAPNLMLTGEEAVHAIRVMRVRVGDPLVLFDGEGWECPGKVLEVNKRELRIQCQGWELEPRMPSNEIILGIAIPKGDRGKEMVERLTELGVSRLVPLIFEHSQRPPSESQIEKLRRVSRESCKQCGRNTDLVLESPKKYDAWIEAQASIEADQRVIAHPGKTSKKESLRTDARRSLAVVGPEGGLSDRELQLAIEHRFKPIDLGPRIYRIETAGAIIAVGLAVRVL